MASENFSNQAQTTLLADISDVDTDLVVGSILGFPPNPSFRIMVDNEIMLVYSLVGVNTMRVTRAQEGTLATAHYAGSSVVHVLTAQGLVTAANEYGNLVYSEINMPANGNPGTFWSQDGIFLRKDTGVQRYYWGPVFPCYPPDFSAMTVYNQSNLNWTIDGTNQTVRIISPNGGGNAGQAAVGKTHSAAGGAWTWVAGILFHGYPVNNQVLGAFVRNSSNNRFYTFGYTTNDPGTEIIRWNDFGNYNSTPYSAGGRDGGWQSSPWWIKWVDTGGPSGVTQAWFSHDSFTWHKEIEFSRGDFVGAPDQIGIYLGTVDQGAAITWISSKEYVGVV